MRFPSIQSWLPLPAPSGIKQGRSEIVVVPRRLSHWSSTDERERAYQSCGKAMSGLTSPSNRRDAFAMMGLQLLMLALSAAFGRYDSQADAKTPLKDADKQTIGNYYPMFQDVHVMIFAGFGFLMSFLKRYGYSSTGFTLLLGALMVQWGILCHGFFRLDSSDHKIPISIESLLSADVATAAILISMGAVLGKTTPLQLLIMGFIEMIVFTANEYLGVEVFKAVDAGGSMYVHVFGAYFGLAVSLALGHGKVIAKSEGEDSKEGSSYTSDIFAMIATIFLWLFWPSFNAGLSTGDDKHRAVINTYLSLASCCVMAFATSAVVNKDNKFDMVHIQNSTLAGGVAVGTVCDLMIHPFGAVLIGMLAGVVSVLGYRFLQPYLLSLVHLHDTCGVNNLHGIPGVMSGVMGAVVAGLATEKDYNYSLYQQFPARMPPANSSDYWEYAAHLGGDVNPGVGRSASGQAGYQLLALSVTFLVAWVSGALTGGLLKLPVFSGVAKEHWFDDGPYWKQDEEGAEEVLLVEEGATGRRLLHEMSEVDKVADVGQEG